MVESPLTPARSLDLSLDELDRVAPGAPLLALGQTVFWDEPMKAGVAMALKNRPLARRFVAGVHDTDYFAKLPSGKRQPGKFRSVPHNDTNTRGLWSAAGEFSALFGSETVITRDALLAAGLRLHAVERARPGFLDSATEAYGWRGIVSLDENPPVTMEVSLGQLMPELCATLTWAMGTSVDGLAGEGQSYARDLADELHAKVCELGEGAVRKLGGLYEALAPEIYSFCANAPIDVDVSATSKLLRFNRDTCHLPRFELLNLFLDPATRQMATRAYDESVKGGSGQYGLSRFGTGAIPFDLVIPGLGRGTIRLGTRGAVIGTRQPQFLSFKQAPTSVYELAEIIEKKLGPNCVVVGKAVSLIGMLAREFVFVFHEGASSYVKVSRDFHRRLAAAGVPMQVNPILRIRYDAWSALNVCCSWLRLPEPLRRPFGTEELCAPSFASRWQEVATEQDEVLKRLARLKRPIDLIRYLDESLGGSWKRLAEEYESLHARLSQLETALGSLKKSRDELYEERRRLRAARGEAEAGLGMHFRQQVFEKTPTAEDIARRSELQSKVDQVLESQLSSTHFLNTLRVHQNALVKDPEIRRIHDRRQAIELEAELKRARLIREAIIASEGLRHANHRPSAWWFRMVSPDGLWFRETVNTAHCYLEPLI